METKDKRAQLKKVAREQGNWGKGASSRRNGKIRRKGKGIKDKRRRSELSEPKCNIRSQMTAFIKLIPKREITWGLYNLYDCTCSVHGLHSVHVRIAGL